MKKKINKLEFIKILNVCFSKDTKKSKRQATKWEKIHAKYTPKKKKTVFRINDRLSQSSKKAIHLKI